MKHKCHNHPPIYGDSNPGWSHDEEPCRCSCKPCQEHKRMDQLPEITEEELQRVSEMVQDTTPGPWVHVQFKQFGPDNFLISTSENSNTLYYPVVAELKNPGGFHGMEFMAWCRDGVPRLIKMIRKLQQEVDQLHSLDDRLDRDRDIDIDDGV